MSECMFTFVVTHHNIFTETEVVAFTVTQNTEMTFSPNERIWYNFILTNAGGGFNSQSNEFLCPDSGKNFVIVIQ